MDIRLAAIQIDGFDNVDDRIAYDETAGALWYDADGAQVGAAVQFALLAAGLALTVDDILVIA